MAAFVLALHQSCACTLHVGEGECGNVSLTLFMSCSMPPWDAHLDPDSLTGEDSLLDCSLLSNPAADLLDEFAPVAFAAQPHKGKLALCSQPWPSWPWPAADVKLLLVYINRCSDLFWCFIVPKPLFCFLLKLLKLGMCTEVLREKKQVFSLTVKTEFVRNGVVFHGVGIQQKGSSRQEGWALCSPSSVNAFWVCFLHLGFETCVFSAVLISEGSLTIICHKFLEQNEFFFGLLELASQADELFQP